MKPSPFEPLMLFRSFLTVASGFMASLFCYVLIAPLLGYLFFPEFLEVFQLEEAELKKQMAENLSAVIPWKMFVAHAICSFVVLFFIGWLSAAWAPFLHLQHGLFIAILVGVWFMQTLINDPPSKKVMDMILMITQPVAILLGAQRASRSIAEAANESDETYE